jgi:glucose dehydrogenase
MKTNRNKLSALLLSLIALLFLLGGILRLIHGEPMSYVNMAVGLVFMIQAVTVFRRKDTSGQ